MGLTYVKIHMQTLKYSLHFETEVPAGFEKVKAGFNLQLLKALSPAFPKVNIGKYEGEKPGDEIHIRLDFLLFSWNWHCYIVQNSDEPGHYFFVDEGRQLPPFLSGWRHLHELTEKGNHTLITDHISFSPGSHWPGFLVKFLLWMQFSQRKKTYIQYFSS